MFVAAPVRRNGRGLVLHGAVTSGGILCRSLEHIVGDHGNRLCSVPNIRERIVRDLFRRRLIDACDVAPGAAARLTHAYGARSRSGILRRGVPLQFGDGHLRNAGRRQRSTGNILLTLRSLRLQRGNRRRDGILQCVSDSIKRKSYHFLGIDA